MQPPRPRDARGAELKVGDRVIIRATIARIEPKERFCNCEIVLDIPMPPYTAKTVLFTLNTRQMEKEDDHAS